MISTQGPKSEKEWEAESDFNTLARAEEIKADSRRVSRAKKAGSKIVAQERKALVAKTRVATSSGKKTSSRGGKKR